MSPTTVTSDVETTAVVLAAGGERVVPWEVGVLAGLAEAGLDLRRAKGIVGTSAGSLVAAHLALGVDQLEQAERIVELGVPAPPSDLTARAEKAIPKLLRIQAEAAELPVEERSRRVGRFALAAATIAEEDYVARVAERVPDVGWPSALVVLTVNAQSGDRCPLSETSGASLPRGVAAGRAVPGVLPPVTVGGRHLMDAVVISGTNADVVTALGVDHVVVITPAAEMADPRTVDAALEAGLRGERAALERAGMPIHVIRADAQARAAMGDRLYEIADAGAAVAAGRRTGKQFAEGRGPGAT